MTEEAESGSRYLVHKGQYGCVEFARMPDGTVPAGEFWSQLSEGQKAKFLSLFARIASDPHLRLNNRQQFKQVEGDLYEFKRNDIQMRVFAFRHGSRWLLVWGFVGKKENKLPAGEVARALDRMQRARQAMGI